MIKNQFPPRISVIMPVYNNVPYLNDGIDCILNQTFSDYELIILNDGSTDGSEEIIEKYAKKDKRIVFINDSINKGFVFRLNQGLKLAKGEFIARADGDDICIPTRFEKQINFLDTNPNVTLCSAWFEYIGIQAGIICHPLIHEDIKVSLLENCVFVHSLMMCRRSFFIANKIEYDPLAIAAEDYDLFTRIVEKAIFANIPEVMLQYRIHSAQASNQNAEIQWLNSDKCRERMLSYIWEFKSDEDKRLASLIARTSSINKVSDAEKILKILDKLVINNSKQRFYDEKKFNIFIERKGKNAVLYVYHNKKIYNLKVLFEFISASKNFKRKLLILEKIKLFIKCIILWKKKT